ncbi:MAG: winged helix-turn-helix transcriptional regulator [Candidatus Bathyarchaeota archaeon]|nr:winged helix-turn-helix transcriptional regulator [Candidatus Bathyarchaeota archaeon]
MSKAHHFLLRDKGALTKFQILFEIMRQQPHIKQKDVSEALGITIQAVSKHFKTLMKEGLLEAGSERAEYRLTAKAYEKLQDYLKNIDDYVKTIKTNLKVERLIPAIAMQPVKAGDTVGLVMKDGVLCAVASARANVEASGIAINDANAGEDVGLKDVKGKVKVLPGKVLLVRLPSIKEGGSRAVDIAKVRMLHEAFKPDRIGVIGVVGRAVLNKIGLKADFEFGISRATAVAASRGLKVFVLVVGRMANHVIDEIDMENFKHATHITYEVEDARIP